MGEGHDGGSNFFSFVEDEDAVAGDELDVWPVGQGVGIWEGAAVIGPEVEVFLQVHPLGENGGGFLVGAEELVAGSCAALVDGAGEVEGPLGVDLENGSVGVFGVERVVGGRGEVG